MWIIKVLNNWNSWRMTGNNSKVTSYRYKSLPEVWMYGTGNRLILIIVRKRIWIYGLRWKPANDRHSGRNHAGSVPSGNISENVIWQGRIVAECGRLDRGGWCRTASLTRDWSRLTDWKALRAKWETPRVPALVNSFKAAVITFAFWHVIYFSTLCSRTRK